ncbi:CBS domain-containing protein [Streptomyces sp. NPDC006784]|uniref:CBS domain-containing protein n=1 Tax=Streptomyces sp. NPDC006784 TaxID=3364764 RepID=UPI00368ADD74
MRHRTVRDLMTRPAVCVNPGTGLKETARLMAEHDISAVPVVDENEKPVGMVSEGDLVRAQAELPEPAELLPAGHARTGRRRTGRTGGTGGTGGKAMDGSGERPGTAGALMSSPVVPGRPDWSLVEAARTMRSNGVKRLPVVGETGRMLGIISRADLMAVFLRRDDAIADEITDDVLHGTLGLSATQVSVTVSEGVVRVRGRIGAHDSPELLERLCRAVDGVVDVRLDLSGPEQAPAAA